MAESGTGKVKILIIDDDKKFCRLLKDYLEPMGFEVAAEYDGISGLKRAIEGSYQAVILDVMLPQMDGFEVLRRLRKQSDLPVLMLTARGDEVDRIAGLETGADDYLPKTSSVRELLARLRAIIRRAERHQTTPNEPQDQIIINKLKIIPSSRIAFLDERPLDLTPVEFDLLLSLARAKGRVKTREQLLDEIAGRDYIVFDRSIDVHISALRKKLGDDPKQPRFIRTMRSAGYMFIDPNSDWFRK
ncbi:MAG: response regulator transcription factor [Verrucomicrobiia bacterium]|jgi:DNA-binding response OmpR family regulator